MQKRFRLAAGLLVGILSVTPLRADRLPELGDSASSELSLSTEKRIGQQIMHEIRSRELSYLDDPEIESYLNQLGGRLAGFSSDPGIGFYFFAIDDPAINAFAMPGGFIGVHTGLILTAQGESELAGVLSHEISHVTQRHLARQIQREKQMTIPSMVLMALALVAARSNSQAASAAVAVGQGVPAQAQMAFSRDFEREADRAGFETLQKSGFDVRGMSIFFDRLQRASHSYENNALVYLRTHPLAGERMADMQNREQKQRYKQVADSIEFHLVRAKLRALKGAPDEAISDFRELVSDKKYASVGAAHYGLAVALARSRNWADAERELQAAKKLHVSSPMIERLLADCRIGQGDVDGGLLLFREAMARYPLNTALIYAYGDVLVAQKRFADSLAFAENQLRHFSQDVRLFRLQAQSFEALGRRAQQHRALAEAYAVQGLTGLAVEQIGLAQRAGDANFYELSAIDARQRELKQRQKEEDKEKR